MELADFGANLLGSSTFITQELAWDEQRIKLKWSFHRKKYSDASLNQRSDVLFGKSTPARFLKIIMAKHTGPVQHLNLFCQRIISNGFVFPWVMVPKACLAEQKILEKMIMEILFSAEQILKDTGNGTWLPILTLPR